MKSIISITFSSLLSLSITITIYLNLSLSILVMLLLVISVMLMLVLLILSLFSMYIDINSDVIKIDDKCMIAVKIIASGLRPPAKDIVGIDWGIFNNDSGL